jgi:uncharacterized membrane protein
MGTNMSTPISSYNNPWEQPPVNILGQVGRIKTPETKTVEIRTAPITSTTSPLSVLSSDSSEAIITLPVTSSSNLQEEIIPIAVGSCESISVMNVILCLLLIILITVLVVIFVRRFTEYQNESRDENNSQPTVDTEEEEDKNAEIEEEEVEPELLENNAS